MRNLTICLAIAALILIYPQRSSAQDYYWTQGSGGSWSNATNWNFGFAASSPHTAGDSANLSFLTSSAKTITLDGSVSIHDLAFNNFQTGAVTLTPGTGGSLTLNSSNADPTTLSVSSGSGDHTITAHVTLGGSTTHQWNIGAGRTFTTSGSISGNRGLTKTGTGTLLVNGTNTYTGATTVSAGTLGGHGSIASAVAVATGATITAGISPVASTLTLGNGLSLSGKYGVTLFSNNTLSKIVAPAGLVNLSGGSLEVVLGSGVTVSSFRSAGPRSFTIIDAANNKLSGTFSTTNFTSAGFLASEWSVAYNTATGNTVLNFTPVPEPSLVLGLGALTLAAGWGVRRRNRAVVA